MTTLRTNLVIGIGLALAAAACDPNQVIKVPTPDSLSPGSLNSAASLPALENGTLAQFQIMYSGGADQVNNGHEGYINITGLFTDEFIDLETFTTRQQIDARSALPSNGTLKGLFIDLTQARAIADKTDAAFGTFAPTDSGRSTVLALDAYAYTFFAEFYCEGVPVSSISNSGQVTYGLPLTREQLLTIAAEKFDSSIAIATATGNATTLALAQVGLARALVDSNDYASAATVAAAVPSGYVYLIGASTNTAFQNNGVWNYTLNFAGFGVSDSEGTNGLPFVSDSDPRVPTLDTHALGVGRQPDTLIAQLLYPEQASPTPLATYTEAQLIIAENDLRTGNTAGWLAILNALRASFPGPGALAPLVDPGTPAARVNLHFHERAFWLFLTAHRLGDMRRLLRQYGRAANTVFPIGTSVNGIPYGTAVEFQISEDEQNNPNFHGCLNLNP